MDRIPFFNSHNGAFDILLLPTSGLLESPIFLIETHAGAWQTVILVLLPIFKICALRKTITMITISWNKEKILTLHFCSVIYWIILKHSESYFRYVLCGHIQLKPIVNHQSSYQCDDPIVRKLISTLKYWKLCTSWKWEGKAIRRSDKDYH